MVKKKTVEYAWVWDEGELGNEIHALKIEKLHGDKTKELVGTICKRVIPLVHTQNLIFVDPEDIKKKAHAINKGKRKQISTLHEFNPDDAWNWWALVRKHFSSTSFETKMIRGYIFSNPLDNSIIAVLYTHLENPDKEYILVDSEIVKNSRGANYLITTLREKYKKIWEKTHSS